MKNKFRVNLVRNILQNFHEDKPIIQGRSMYLMFFDILAYLYGWLPRYRDVKATSWDAVIHYLLNTEYLLNLIIFIIYHYRYIILNQNIYYIYLLNCTIYSIK